MRTKGIGAAILLLVCLAGTALAFDDARLLRMPDVRGDRVVFVYAGDLWTAPLAGGRAARLTAHPGTETGPKYSPDGRWIAFNAQYEGNFDVYVIPAEGGSPRRLTWHPVRDNVVGWTPDSRAVLFTSSRECTSGRDEQLFQVPLDGGLPEKYPLPLAFSGSLSPDGKSLAYTPLPDAFGTWRRYRGGMAPFVQVYNTADHSVRKVPRTDSNDTSPEWVDGRVAFLSDRDRVMNVHVFDPKTGQVRQVTKFTGADIKSWGSDGQTAVFEREGFLHKLDLASGKSEKIIVRLDPEAVYALPRFVKADKFITDWALSSTGKRAVFAARGEILTVPADKGDIRNLTRTPDAMEREPSWSPDGARIAYFGEENGEYVLKIVDQKGENPPRVVALPDKAYYYSIRWSPDGKKITYKDSRLNLFWMDLEKAAPVRIDTDTYFNFYKDLESTWSPDGKWIAYDKMLDNHYRAIFLYHLESGKTTQVTEGMSDAWSPAFDRGGKYLYFLAGTDRAQQMAWLDLTSAQQKPAASVYAVVLSSTEPSPFQPKSDDEAVKDEKTAEKKDEKPAADAAKAEGDKAKAPGGEAPKTEGDKAAEAVKETKIDLEGIASRIVPVPAGTGYYYGLSAGVEGFLFFLEGKGADDEGEDGPAGNPFKLHRYNMAERKKEAVLDGILAYTLSGDGKKLGYVRGGQYFIADAQGTPRPGEGMLKTDAMEVWSEPRAEWRQMAYEAWKINREWFYDPGMHGHDWAAVWKNYESYLPYLSSRNDLNYIIAQMIGELCVGHAYVYGGDIPEASGVSGGLLGADYAVENGTYKIRKIYFGENWNPGLRAPLREPGVNVKEGEYILEVDGVALKGGDDISRLLLGKANKQVRLKVNGKPALEGARVVTVTPLASESGLRHREWLEANRRKVGELSGGRVGYVYLPDTAGGGFTNFNRYFFPQTDKDGLVVDERNNGGGLIADYFVEWLSRPLSSWWMHRMGKPITSPLASVYGPKALIINEAAGSGGDAFPYLFRQAKLGPIVGKRTWGGLVGITGYPPLMDGGGVTSPCISIVSTDGKFVVENHGVDPDIEVEITPADYIAGRDPQLEKAVQSVLDALKTWKKPVFQPEPFPRGR